MWYVIHIEHVTPFTLVSISTWASHMVPTILPVILMGCHRPLRAGLVAKTQSYMLRQEKEPDRRKMKLDIVEHTKLTLDEKDLEACQALSLRGEFITPD